MTIAAPAIDWAGGTPPQAQSVLVSQASIDATANLDMTNVIPAPQGFIVGGGGGDSAVGYSTG